MKLGRIVGTVVSTRKGFNVMETNLMNS